MGIYNIHAGHNPDGKTACGAIGLIKESTENRKVANEVVRLLVNEKNVAYNCTVDNGTSVGDVINKIVAKCNSNKVDLDISIHFNSGANDKTGNNKSTGVEVLVYKTGGVAEQVAKRVCENVSKLGFKNRGVKVRTDLGYLKKTSASAILIECCFVDDKDDINMYNYQTMAKAIVEGILGKSISPPVNTTEETFYRVICGSYKDVVNAERVASDLRDKGYSAFIDIFKK